MGKKTVTTKPGAKAKKIVGIICGVLAAVIVLGVVAGSEIYNSGIVQRNTVAAETENFSVSATMMNYFFNTTYQNEVNSSNAAYYSYLGLDTSLHLEDQEYNNGVTWHDYFLDGTKSQVEQILILCEAAKAAGFELTEEDKNEIEANIYTFETLSSSYGYSNVDSFLNANYGCNEKDLRKCLEISTLAQKYSDVIYDGFEYSDDDIAKYYEDNKDTFLKVDYLSYTFEPAEESTTSTTTTTDTTKETTAETTADTTTETTAETEAATADGAATVDPNASADDKKEEDDKVSDEEKAALKAAAEALKATTSEEAFNAYVKGYLRNTVYAGLSDEALLADEIDIDELVADCKTEGYTVPATATDLSKWLFDDARVAYEVHTEYNEDEATYTVYMILPTQYADDLTYACKYRDAYTTADYYYISVPASDHNDSMETALSAAETMLAEYEKDGTEEAFAELESTDKYGEGNGKQEDAAKGLVNDTIDAWVYNAERKEGDAAVLEGEDGYYVVYYAGANEVKWTSDADTACRNEDYNEKYAELSELYDVVFRTKGLGFVGLISHEGHNH